MCDHAECIVAVKSLPGKQVSWCDRLRGVTGCMLSLLEEHCHGGMM